jgi:hypothetical protein
MFSYKQDVMLSEAKHPYRRHAVGGVGIPRFARNDNPRS